MKIMLHYIDLICLRLKLHSGKCFFGAFNLHTSHISIKYMHENLHRTGYM